ncbi:MAG: dihydroorotate dehydrogenase electron transfer subunit, partial [Porphyromonas sp.]|nr:dihydroorotate dehydrogenase electron transfer subunit [Porphyromonas sp.]
MYKKGRYTILSNTNIAEAVWQMVLEGDTQYFSRPGQFVNILVQGHFLRRPISVCYYDDKTLTLIYKVFGSGTETLSKMSVGSELDLLTGLGNGFDISAPIRRPLLVGGGVGVPPLYKLCKDLVEERG